jgi:sugar lactone lactonase YvrE
MIIATGISGSDDGTGNVELFDGPVGICIDTTSGYLYVADYYTNKVRKASMGGVVTSVTINPSIGFPIGICQDITGNLYIASENSIFKVSSQGVSTTVQMRTFLRQLTYV